MKRLFFTLMALSVIALSYAAKPKYVFVFVGDGMGMGHVMAAETYNRTVLGNDENILMMRFPVASLAMTYSDDSPVTDSAAAGTALATGFKTKNSMVGMSPDTVAVESVSHELKEKFGYGVGIVTSVCYDDATPATHFAHQANRGMYEEINRDGACSGFDFIAGANTSARNDGEKAGRIFDEYRKNGYTVINGLGSRNELEAGDKILLTAPYEDKAAQIGYTIDSIQGAATLSQLTRLCLGHLMKVSPDKFFMMVEAGNIDHAAHGNDGGAVVKEILNFQEAIQVAYDFYLRHPKETLIVVTADHDTGGMTVGVDKGPSRPVLKNIDYQRISKERFSDVCVAEGGNTWQEMKSLLSEKLGFWSHIPVDEVEEARMLECYGRMKAKAAGTQKTLYKDFNEFTAVVFDILNHKTGLGFTTFSHTGNPVPVFAVGVGCGAFSDLNNNIEIPQKIRKLTGLAD